MERFGVYSEVGKLRSVIVHRPDMSLTRLTPANHDELLFDDVLWVERAQWEHDQFVGVLREGMAIDTHDAPGLYFGTSTGQVFASADEGESWSEIASYLPAISSVEVATVG